MGGRLFRRDEKVGDPIGPEMRRQGPQDPGRDRAAVGTAVQGEIFPTVGVTGVPARRQIRWIREDEVEPTQPPRQIGPDRRYGEAVGKRPVTQRRQRRGVEVGGDDLPSPRSGGGERREAPTAADLQDALAGTRPGEPGQQPTVLADGIDLDPRRRAGTRHDSHSGDRRVPKSS